MNAAHLLQIIASIAALVAVSLGMGTYTHCAGYLAYLYQNQEVNSHAET